MLLSQPTLSHDEAQYAIDALDTLAGAPARWFYLSPGMRALALPGVLVGGDTALRIIPLLGGLAFLAVVLRLGTRTVGLAGAAWTLVVLAGTKTFARYSIDLLSDLPACTCMLAALAIIVDELLGDHPPRWRLLACAPLLAGAFYVRYGSVVPIAVIVLAALGFSARRVTQAPGPVVATAALFPVLVAPHAGCAGRPIDVAATAARGEPVYIVRDETPTWRDVGQPDTRSHPHRIVTLVPGMVEVVRLTTP
jgi:predicted membrane-bound mannosyltransferase